MLLIEWNCPIWSGARAFFSCCVYIVLSSVLRHAQHFDSQQIFTQIVYVKRRRRSSLSDAIVHWCDWMCKMFLIFSSPCIVRKILAQYMICEMCSPESLQTFCLSTSIPFAWQSRQHKRWLRLSKCAFFDQTHHMIILTLRGRTLAPVAENDMCLLPFVVIYNCFIYKSPFNSFHIRVAALRLTPEAQFVSLRNGVAHNVTIRWRHDATRATTGRRRRVRG